MLCGIEMQDLSPVVTQDDQHEEDLKRGRRDGEDIERHQLFGVVLQEGSPGLGWRPSTPEHVLRNGGFSHLKAKLEQFTVNSRCAPQGVGPTHSAD